MPEHLLAIVRMDYGKTEFRFNHWDHDSGWKIIFDRKGHFDGDDVIDILLNQSETSEFIARKFWKNYVSDFNFNDEEIKKNCRNI